LPVAKHGAGSAGVAGTLGRLLAACLLLTTAGTNHAADRPVQECVILLHGLGRTAYSMAAIEDALVNAGYCVWNKSYPSRAADIEWLAATAINDGLAYCESQQAVKTHFVTHSLGGILVRQFLQDNRIDNLGRIVMLSPPNKGSEVADLLQDHAVYRFATGPAGQQLGTGPNSLPLRLARIPGEIGIITGTSSFDPWFSPMIPGEDDGKVSVEHAKLAEMSDFLLVGSSHTFIMNDKDVIAQILTFLQRGKFSRGQGSAAPGER
jgi:triacylglycerol lipase